MLLVETYQCILSASSMEVVKTERQSVSLQTHLEILPRGGFLVITDHHTLSSLWRAKSGSLYRFVADVDSMPKLKHPGRLRFCSTASSSHFLPSRALVVCDFCFSYSSCPAHLA